MPDDDLKQEQHLARIKRILCQWFDWMEEQGDAEGEIPELSEGQHRAFKAGTELFARLLRERYADQPQKLVVSLEKVSTEELMRLAQERLSDRERGADGVRSDG